MDKARIHELETQRANLIFAFMSPNLPPEQKAKIERMLNAVEGELVLAGVSPRELIRESGEISPGLDYVNLTKR